jgi:phosphatidylglycerol---prolipoprotein diacylglyceryl transferase
LHPVLFRLPFGVPVYSYGVMLGLSILLGWYISRTLSERRDGFPPSLTGALYVTTIASAIAGARLLYVLTNLERFDAFGDVFRLNQGGLVAYGGFLGGFFGSWIYCRVHGLSILAWGDAATPSMSSGLFLTRIGCLLYGCDYGQPWNGAWAITFPPGSPCYNQQRVEGLLPEHASRSLPVHPTQIYESAVGLVLFLFLMWVWSRRKHRGEVMLAFTMGYGALRFLLETVRGDDQRGAVAGLSTSQIIAVVTSLLAAFAWVWLRRRPAGAPMAAPTLATATTPRAAGGRRRRRRG